MYKKFLSVALASSLLFAERATAQSEIYPQHFDLSEVTLLNGPMKTMMETNDELLLKYDADRLMTPFIRQAGLSKNPSSKYNGWEEKHPNFPNWGGDAGFDLSGHVGGHYVSALALAYAATNDANMKARMKEKLDYCLNIMKDCQDAYKDDFSVNIHDDVVDTFYDSANNVYYYIFVTVDGIEKMLTGDQAQTVGAGSMVTTYSAVNLKDCALKAGPLALCTSLPTEGGQLQITCRNNQKEDITMDQFVGITDTTFAGMARSNTSFDWFRADEAATLERFTNSYAVFEGRRDINASNIKNNFMQDAAGVFVTRNPTLERCAVGGTASFYAYANAYDGVVWSFVSADGKQTYNAAQFMQAYGGTVSGEYSTDLQIANVNQSMNGCSVYATFSYKGMLARSCHANLYVWQNVPQGYVNYTYGIKDSRVQTPVSNLGTVYVNYNIQGWTCPSCGAWARGDECWNCGYKPGAVPGDIQGWTCPNCGSWARGDECWSCGYRPGTGTGEIMGWTCPSCGSWARGDECWNCGYKPGSGTGGGGSYDINGWTCPYCGSWTRGSECWNCGYSARYGTATLNGGGGNITGDDGDQGYTPIEGQYIDDDGDAGYTPIEGQYIDDDGDAGYTPIEEDDISGFSCPVCGEWIRGGECWNCGYTM